MSQQIRFQILKSLSGQEYQLAINGVLLNGKQLDGSSISVSTDMLASMFSMSELSEMFESKKRCEEYTKQMFVSNRELAEWLNAKEGRRCHVVVFVSAAWQPTRVFLPGESHGQRRLMGYSPWGRRVGLK